MPVFVLSVHADYACRHAGACCTAGWRIPVERACEDRLIAARLAQTTKGGAPFERDASDTVIALAPDGACSLFERATRDTPPLCAVHRVLGHDALPSACRHFPRVAVTDDAGTFVTLSHYCPTAAVMLFGSDEALLSIVEAPDAFHSVTEYEGSTPAVRCRRCSGRGCSATSRAIMRGNAMRCGCSRTPRTRRSRRSSS